MNYAVVGICRFLGRIRMAGVGIFAPDQQLLGMFNRSTLTLEIISSAGHFISRYASCDLVACGAHIRFTEILFYCRNDDLNHFGCFLVFLCGN